MTKATMAGDVGDVNQFRADHPTEGATAAAAPGALNGPSMDPIVDEADITSPGWDASAMPKRDQLEQTADETQEKLLEQAEAYVVANPLKAIAAGLVAGVVLGRML